MDIWRNDYIDVEKTNCLGCNYFKVISDSFNFKFDTITTFKILKKGTNTELYPKKGDLLPLITDTIYKKLCVKNIFKNMPYEHHYIGSIKLNNDTYLHLINIYYQKTESYIHIFVSNQNKITGTFGLTWEITDRIWGFFNSGFTTGFLFTANREILFYNFENSILAKNKKEITAKFVYKNAHNYTLLKPNY